MLPGAIHRPVEATSELLAWLRIVMASWTWQAVEVPNWALEPGHRVPLSRPPVESTRSRVNDSPCSARRARTKAESREAGTGVTLDVSGPASSPLQPAIIRASGSRRQIAEH